MSDRILVWYVDNITGSGVEQGPVYYMEQDYVPIGLRIMAKAGPDAADLSLDILDDGVTILARQAKLPKGQATDDAADEFPQNVATIREGSLVSLNLTPNGAKGITVQLELEAG